jgi:hypothetical protein
LKQFRLILFIINTAKRVLRQPENPTSFAPINGKRPPHRSAKLDGRTLDFKYIKS